MKTRYMASAAAISIIIQDSLAILNGKIGLNKIAKHTGKTIFFLSDSVEYRFNESQIITPVIMTLKAW